MLAGVIVMRMRGGDQLEKKFGEEQNSRAGVGDQKKHLGIGDVEEDLVWRVSEDTAPRGDLVCAHGESVGFHVDLVGVHEIFHENVLHENVLREILMSDEIDPKGLPKSRSKRTDNF